MRALAIILGVLAAVVFLAALIVPLFFLPFGAAPPSNPADWWRWMWGWMPAMVPFMMLFIVLFWALFIGLLVLLGVWLWRQLQGQPARGSADNSALRILQERYARGEIDREEYEQRRSDLMSEGR